MGVDQTYYAHHFIFSFTFQFLFIPCGRLSWLPVSFLLHVKYARSYRIVSYRISISIGLGVLPVPCPFRPLPLLVSGRKGQGTGKTPKPDSNGSIT